MYELVLEICFVYFAKSTYSLHTAYYIKVKDISEIIYTNPDIKNINKKENVKHIPFNLISLI